jgi:hypothetical protein
MEKKDESEILRCLKLFWRDTRHKIVSIRCDAEAGLDSRTVNRWFDARKISVKTITDQNHTSLSVVDRLIRTLRDMNVPTEKSKRTSENRKYRDFTEKRMKKLIKIYNDTTHKTTGMRPTEMHGSDEEEKRYIIKKLYESERRHKLKDYNLEDGTFVKYIVPRKDKEKHRYKVSPECYKLSGKDGHAYIIMAKDGSTLTLTRWRLIPIGKTIPEGMKWGGTINNAKHGIIKAILKHNATQYKVEWQSPTDQRIVTWEPIKDFKRERKHKGKVTRHEATYWKGKRYQREF